MEETSNSRYKEVLLMEVEACENIVVPGLSASVTNKSKNADCVRELQWRTMQLLCCFAEMGLKRVISRTCL